MELAEYLEARAKGTRDLGGFFLPAREPRTFKMPAARPGYMVDQPRHILVTTDMQIPFHDEALHHLSCQFAHDIRADEWVDLGDFLDLPMLSNWRAKPGWETTMQETVDAGRQVLHDRTSAAPAWCRKRKADGNHDARMGTFLINKAPQLRGLRRAILAGAVAQAEAEEVLDLDYLMHSATEGWESVTGYPYNEIDIAPGLIGIHGHRVLKGAGRTVYKELLERDTSVIMGHVNNMALASYTRGSREKRTTYGYEVGPMCRREGSLGFGLPTADWSPGLAVVTRWPGGTWNVELVPYLEGEFRWRDRAWRLSL